MGSAMKAKVVLRIDNEVMNRDAGHKFIPPGLVGLIAGATERLGKATAESFLKQGVRLSLVGDKETECPEKLAEYGNNILFHPIDITDNNEVETVFNATQDKFGGLDFSIHCFEISTASLFYNFTRDASHEFLEEYMMNLLQYNTVGTFNFCRHAARLICKNEPNAQGERGCIINTTHVAADEGFHGQALYGASKAAINSMTLPLARDLASHGVRANTIQIGHMDTELHVKKGPLSLIPFLISQIPFPKRLGDPEEYVHLVHTILDNPMINGEIIRLDGGVRFPFFKWTRP